MSSWSSKPVNKNERIAVPPANDLKATWNFLEEGIDHIMTR